MRVLSIQQPWAWLIVNGYKPVENRTWDTPVRGDILIHAGKKFDRDGWDFVNDFFPDIPLPAPSEFLMGGIVGKANLTDVVTQDSSEFFFGPYGFKFADAAPLPFTPLRGQLGFFAVDWPIAERAS